MTYLVMIRIVGNFKQTKMTNSPVLAKNIKIRACVGDDYVFVHRLSRKNMEGYIKKYWGSWDSKKFKESFRKENVWVVTYFNKRIGFFEITQKKSMAYLNNMQLAKNFQGRGIGNLMLMRAEKQAKKAGIKKIQLQVFKDNPARIFYKRLGYKAVKYMAHSVMMDKIV